MLLHKLSTLLFQALMERNKASVYAFFSLQKNIFLNKLNSTEIHKKFNSISVILHSESTHPSLNECENALTDICSYIFLVIWQYDLVLPYFLRVYLTVSHDAKLIAAN